jgi:hypothetical protein
LIVVCDTSPILNLSAVDQLGLLKSLYSEIVIPPWVNQDWVKTISAQNQREVMLLREQLDPGESEAIVLAGELKAELLLLDEKRGRGIATTRGLEVTGRLGVLAEAKARGLIPNCMSILDDMIRIAGFWIGEDLRTQYLRAMNEGD